MPTKHTVIETPRFLTSCKRLKIGEHTRDEIVDYIAQNPTTGSVMPGTGGARKVRIAGANTGKSGGYRVITFFGGQDIPVFLLNVYSKTDVVNLSKADQNAFKTVLSTLGKTYREGLKGNEKD